MNIRVGSLAVGALASLALVGCGAPDFTGTYNGSLRLAGSCSDGSPVNEDATLSWVIADVEGALTIAPGGNCGTFSADAAGNTATLAPKTCPAFQTAEGLTFVEKLSGGTLTLEDDKLSVNTTWVMTVSGTASGSCSYTGIGTLTKQD